MVCDGTYDTDSVAGYDALLPVASLTSSGAPSSFSSYGQTTVDLAAPGSGVSSTLPGAATAPTAALYASLHPEAAAADTPGGGGRQAVRPRRQRRVPPGDARGLCYNDGKATNAGKVDYGLVMDSHAGDKIQAVRHRNPGSRLSWPWPAP